MDGGKIVFNTKLDNKTLEKDLAKAEKKINDFETRLATMKQKRMPLVEQSKQMVSALDEAKAKLYEMQNASKGTFSKTDLSEQKEHVRRLQSEWNKVQNAVESYDRKIEEANVDLEKAKEHAGDLQRRLAKAGPSSEAMEKAMERAQKSARKWSLRLREVIRSALVFTLISQGLAALRKWLGRVIRTNEEATAAVARLKGALLTLAQPLVDVIIPAFTTFVNVLTTILWVLARFASAMFGTTVEDAKDSAEALDKEQKAIEGVGDAAKKASRSLAGFDEINKLTGENATDTIAPDFSGLDLSELPEKLKEVVLDIEAKIRELRFSWEKGELGKNKDAWIIALTGILGAVIGGMFGGLTGSVIGLLLGLSIGLVSCTFMDDLDNPGRAKDIFIVVLGAILGAVLGAMFGGLTGAIIGLLLGAMITIVSLEFAKGEASTWDSKDTLTVVMSGILGAILGSMFGGLVGGVIGFLLGALISFVSIKFAEGNYDKDGTIAMLRVVIIAILGAILGSMFGGFVGGIIGMVVGLTFGFASVAFDDDLEGRVRTTAKKALIVAITTIVGALIGAAFGFGVFGGIIGGVIGLTFGLAVTFSEVEVKNGLKIKDLISSAGEGITAGVWGASVSSYSITAPGLATGGVIPPNREFMAVLGDNKTETEVVSPLSTMKQALKEALQEAGGVGGDFRFTVSAKPGLARYLKIELDAENARRGEKLVGGAVK